MSKSSSPIEIHTGGIMNAIVVPFHVQVWAVFTAIVQKLRQDAQKLRTSDRGHAQMRMAKAESVSSGMPGT